MKFTYITTILSNTVLHDLHPFASIELVICIKVKEHKIFFRLHEEEEKRKRPMKLGSKCSP